MSSCLKKKKKNKYGISKMEQNAINQKGKSFCSQDAMITEVFKHIQLIGYMTLRDRFGFGRKRLIRFWDKIAGLFDKYRSGELTSPQMATYCVSKNLKPQEWMRSIPQRQKASLSNYKNYKCNPLLAMKYVDAALFTYAMLSAIVLKEEFQFSKPKIEFFWEQLSYYIDSYTTKDYGNKMYLDDEMVNEIMKEEVGIDFLNGKSNV